MSYRERRYSSVNNFFKVRENFNVVTPPTNPPRMSNFIPHENFNPNSTWTNNFTPIHTNSNYIPQENFTPNPTNSNYIPPENFTSNPTNSNYITPENFNINIFSKESTPSQQPPKPPSDTPPVPPPPPPPPATVLEVKSHEPAKLNTSSPLVWGPSFWLVLHSGSIKYPIEASNIVKERMRGFILGIPYIIPCVDCSEHAKAFIEQNMFRMDSIVSGREQLFAFFVEFHNQVNERHKKKIYTVEEAMKMYGDNVQVSKITYE